MPPVPPSLKPLGDDFDEDTLLPPPAPGLVPPSAEHLFDPPTWPGPGPRVEVSTHNAPAVAPSALSPLPPLPEPEVAEREPEVAERAPEPVPTHLLVPRVEDAVVEDADATPRLGTVLPPLDAEPQPKTIRPLQLPPLPPAPATSSALDLVRYAMQVQLSRWQRALVAQKVERSLSDEVEALDRVLAHLGQYAYIEKVDLIALYPPPADVDRQGEPTAVRDLRHHAETWATRIDAEQLRTLAVLTRDEARLSSELMELVEARRRLQVERFALDAQRDPAKAAALFERRHEISDSLTMLSFEIDGRLTRIGSLRVERWVQERVRSHCQRHQPLLLATLESVLAAATPTSVRPPPNLLLLGALLTGQRAFAARRPHELGAPLSTASPPPLELAPSLFLPLNRFQHGLRGRAMLSAQHTVERLAYDRDAVLRAMLFAAVLAGTGLLCLSIAWWALAI